MIISSFRSVAFFVLISTSSLHALPASAAILRSSNEMPVLTKDGACVTTGSVGQDECEAAKKGAIRERESQPPSIVETNSQEDGNTVYFEFNKSELTKSAKRDLDHLASKLLKKEKYENARTKIIVIGYADRMGNATYNQRLALKRAQSVKKYLVSRGTHVRHIDVRSLGKTAPKADCSADLSRGKMIKCLREDRRVEIELVHEK